MPKLELYRSTENRVIAGVCGGLAERFDTDPLLIRLLFIFTLPFGGAPLFAYLFLWVVIPEKNGNRTLSEEVEALQEKYFEHKRMPREHHHHHTHGILGFLLIILGLIFLLDNLFPGFGLRTFWPLVLIFIGLAMMLRHHDMHYGDIHDHEHHDHHDHEHKE